MKDSAGNIVEITRVEKEKDLGVIFDKDLKFSAHISEKINKANRNLGLINKNFTYLSKEMFLNLYKTLVRPHLEYASSVWAPKYKKDQVAIENVQRRATRMIRELAGMSYMDRNKELGLPTLEYRRLRADMIQVYKFIHNIDFNSGVLFDIRGDDTRRGHNYKLFKRRFRTSLGQYVFSNRVVDTWNALPGL